MLHDVEFTSINGQVKQLRSFPSISFGTECGFFEYKSYPTKGLVLSSSVRFKLTRYKLRAPRGLGNFCGVRDEKIEVFNFG